VIRVTGSPSGRGAPEAGRAATRSKGRAGPHGDTVSIERTTIRGRDARWRSAHHGHGEGHVLQLQRCVIGRLELSEDNPPTIIVDQVQSIEASARQNEFLVLRPPQQEDLSTLYDSILSVLSTNPGDTEVAIETRTDNGLVVRIQANNALRVKRSSELEEALKKIGCVISFEKETQMSKGLR